MVSRIDTILYGVVYGMTGECNDIMQTISCSCVWAAFSNDLGASLPCIMQGGETAPVKYKFEEF